MRTFTVISSNPICVARGVEEALEETPEHHVTSENDVKGDSLTLGENWD